MTARSVRRRASGVRSTRRARVATGVDQEVEIKADVGVGVGVVVGIGIGITAQIMQETGIAVVTKINILTLPHLSISVYLSLYLLLVYDVSRVHKRSFGRERTFNHVVVKVA